MLQVLQLFTCDAYDESDTEGDTEGNTEGDTDVMSGIAENQLQQ